VFNNVPNDGAKRCTDMAPSMKEMAEPVAQLVMLLALALAPPAARAQGVAPDALLRAVSVEVIDNIGQDQELQAADPAKIAVLVETRIMPLFDFAHMTRLAMARNWHLATPEQQTVLTAEFKTLLVRTYSTALAHYRGEVINYRQLRVAPLDAAVTVKSVVKQPGKESMTLDYDMEKTAAGWKIYDIKVAGVSLITTYREMFAEKIRSSGVDGLIKTLADGNRGGSSRFNSIKTSFWEKSRVLFEIFRNMFRSGPQ
jgi:phospholipid transport system substrate-binding protein